MKSHLIRNNIALLILLFSIVSCRNDTVPKPRGYFRIALPEHQYEKFDSTFPYRFEFPEYAAITGDPFAPEEPYWINVSFPEFKGKLHLSYKKVKDGNLAEYLEDSRKFVLKHIPKANSIEDSLIIDRNRRIFGLYYEIHGGNAASPVQFFVTDSSKHFVRGALYFNVRPNNDSLRPVIEFLKKDIIHMINTFRWNETINKKQPN
jgi:gliding motility-associated lipoprotein GldD